MSQPIFPQSGEYLISQYSLGCQLKAAVLALNERRTQKKKNVLRLQSVWRMVAVFTLHASTCLVSSCHIYTTDPRALLAHASVCVVRADQSRSSYHRNDTSRKILQWALDLLPLKLSDYLGRGSIRTKSI
jgi:hypothetical protein